MMVNRFHEILEAFSDIVKAVEDLEIVQKETVAKLKAKLRLFDGSILWVREVYVYDLMEVYSYYWLRPDETMIIGWDNAPHHNDVKTYPHHKHIAGKVENSDQRNLQDILNFIKWFFND
jgi:hypothetical protein